MAICATCGSYYRLSAYNNTEVCDDCLAPEDSYEEIDAETEIDIYKLKNPSGRTPLRFNEGDLEEDSFGL